MEIEPDTGEPKLVRYVAVVNAVVDGLAPFGVRHIDMPLKAEKIWRAMQSSEREVKP